MVSRAYRSQRSRAPVPSLGVGVGIQPLGMPSRSYHHNHQHYSHQHHHHKSVHRHRPGASLHISPPDTVKTITISTRSSTTTPRLTSTNPKPPERGDCAATDHELLFSSAPPARLPPFPPEPPPSLFVPLGVRLAAETLYCFDARFSSGVSAPRVCSSRGVGVV